jgi:hypothetical protein
MVGEEGAVSEQPEIIVMIKIIAAERFFFKISPSYIICGTMLDYIPTIALEERFGMVTGRVTMPAPIKLTRILR